MTKGIWKLLKNCPSCGARANRIRQHPRHQVGCSKCPLMTAGRNDENVVIDAWNACISSFELEILQKQNQLLVKALEALVETKRIKETFGKTGEYEQLRTKVWANAEEVLAGLDSPELEEDLQ